MSTEFNFSIYAEEIKQFIPDIEDDDLKWLCNKAAEQYKDLETEVEHIDNFRISRIVEDEWSAAYEKVYAKGCCGFSDVKHTNPLTGNEFVIGFNYGH